MMNCEKKHETARSVRALSLLICILMLVTCASLLCSCGETEQGTNQANTESESETAKSTGSDMFPYIEDGLPEKMDFQGATVSHLYRSNDTYNYETYREKFDSADKIDTAVFNKNEIVQYRLGIQLNFVPANGEAHGLGDNGVIGLLSKAGVNEYQIVSNSNFGMVAKLLSGSFLNLKTAPYLDLSKKYWAEFVNENATVHGTICGITGSISLYLYDVLYITLFNKKLCETYGISSSALYQTVRSKDWTLDYMISITKDVYDDLGERGKDPKDLYGFAIQLSSSTDGYWSSCNIQLTSRDDEGNIVYDVDAKKLSEVVRKLNAFTWESEGVLRIVEDGRYENKALGIYYITVPTLISGDRALFANATVIDVRTDEMRACSYYGILPYPKYNQKQKSYYSYVHDTYTCYAVPLTAVPSLDVTGATLEALASEGHNSVLPVYYEDVLTTRYVRDPDSVEMLNIIFGNVKLDAAWIFVQEGVQVPQRLLREMVWENNNGVAKEIKEATGPAQNSYRYTSQQLKKFLTNNR